MDVIEIDAASNTSVDDVRDLRENVRYAPAGGKYKIYIIDEVHRLSGAAFDALLKTLEEPPDHVIFIFATTEPHNLPATILSRTQRYDFRRIPLSDLVDSLRRASDSEGVTITDDALALVARKGDGSLRDALSLFEQILAYADGEITIELITDALGLVDLNLLFDLSDAIHNHNSGAILDLVAKLTESGSDVGQFLIDFQEHLRNMLIASTVPAPEQFIELSDLYIKRYIDNKDYFSDSDIMRMVKVISDLRQQLKEGAEPRIFLEMALLKLARMDTTATLTEVLHKLSNLSGGSLAPPPPSSNLFGSGNTQAGKPEEKRSLKINPAVSEKPAGDPDPTGISDSRWVNFLNEYTQINGMLSIMLKRGKVRQVNNNVLRLTFPPDAGISALLTPDKVRQLETSIEEQFGRRMKLKFDTDPNMKTDQPKTTLDPRFDMSPADMLNQNPDIKKIVEKYNGKITSIKKIDTGGKDNG
jgi:DNA polymerase-3 subunit gamma/tau